MSLVELDKWENNLNNCNVVIENVMDDIIKTELRENKYCRQYIQYILENREFFEELALEKQIKSYHWNKQWGHLLSENHQISQNDILSEDFVRTLIIDLIITALPAIARAAGGAGAFATFGGSALIGEGLAKFFASGGALYYFYYAGEDYDNDGGFSVNCFFNCLNALFSLEQAMIPGVSDVIAAAGRLSLGRN